jgi:hypothetical protein
MAPDGVGPRRGANRGRTRPVLVRPSPPITYCRELRTTSMFAFMFASEENSSIRVSHFLKALYVCELERILRYWGRWSDWENIEEFLAREYGLTQPRWYYWFKFYELCRSGGAEGPFLSGMLPFDEQMNAVSAAAADLAERQERSPACVGIKEILGAICLQQNLRERRLLIDSGLDPIRLPSI